MTLPLVPNPPANPIRPMNHPSIPPLLRAAVLLLALALPEKGALVALPARQQTLEVAVTLRVPVERKATITLHRDHEDPLTFYYLPLQPQLVTAPAGAGKEAALTMPQFLFQKFQLSDRASAANKQIEGAILQFAVTLGYTAAQLAEIEAGIRAAAKVPEDQKISLRPVAIKNPKVIVYDPSTGQALAGGAPGGLAPTSLTAEIPFSVKLDVLSSTLNDRIVRERTGVPCWFVYEYDQITEPAGFKVTVNWDNVYTHFSSASESKAQDRGRFLFWTWSNSETNTSMRAAVDHYQSTGMIKVEGITTEKLSAEQLQVYLQPILEKVSALVAGEAPPKIDPATCAPLDTEPGGSGAQANVNATVKSLTERKTGTQTYNFNFREVLSTGNQANGFIGIGDYLAKNPGLETLLVPPTVSDSDDFAKANFALPNVVTPRSMGVTEIAMSLSNTAGNDEKVLMTWRPDDVKAGGKGSWYRDGQPVSFIELGVGAFRGRLKAKGTLDQWKDLLKFPVETTITCFIGNKGSEETITISDKREIPGFNGQAPMLRPLDHMKTAEIDASLLGSLMKDPKADKVRIALEVPDGGSGSHLIAYEWTSATIEEPFMFPLKRGEDGKYRFKIVDLQIRSNRKLLREAWFPSDAKAGVELTNKLFLEFDEEILTDKDWFQKI